MMCLKSRWDNTHLEAYMDVCVLLVCFMLPTVILFLLCVDYFPCMSIYCQHVVKHCCSKLTQNFYLRPKVIILLLHIISRLSQYLSFLGISCVVDASFVGFPCMGWETFGNPLFAFSAVPRTQSSLPRETSLTCLLVRTEVDGMSRERSEFLFATL